MPYIQPHILDEIGRVIGTQRPELGGGLLGPQGQEIVSLFIFDEEAQVTGASYSPSRSLARKIREIESSTNLEWKGVVHSHPGGLNRPSSGDDVEITNNFRLNQHMKLFFCPIVSFDNVRHLEENELTCGRGKISMYIARRDRRDTGCQISPFSNKEEIILERTPTVPDLLGKHLQSVIDKLHPSRYEILRSSEEQPDLVPVRLLLDGVELLLLFSKGSYPTVPPVLLVTPEGENTHQVNPMWWDLEVPDEERLLDSLSRLVKSGGSADANTFRMGYGPSGGPVLTSDPQKAKLAGWELLVTQQNAEAEAEQIHNALFARSNGILAQGLKKAHVIIAGLGSGGSYAAKELVRAGIGEVTLIDAETVEGANLSRTEYALSDINRRKTDALAQRLLQINPALVIHLHCCNVQDLDVQVIHDLVADADLVFAATDDIRAQTILGHFAYYLGKPAIFGGMYAGAQGGEVIFTVPDKTSCFLCATRVRQTTEAATSRVSGTTDYGTGRLTGEMALAVDIQHITSAAIKMALSLLLKGLSSDANLASFLDTQIQENMNYVTFSTVPNYWFYPHIFGETPGQSAYQSVWMTVDKVPECPICGQAEYRSDPLKMVLKAPKIRIEA